MEKVKITKENYEAFLLDMAEGNLSKANEELLNVFLLENPELMPLNDEYDPNICIKNFPNDVFPNKNRLLFATRRKNIIIRYISAAAILLLIVGISLFINYNSHFTKTNPINYTAKSQNNIQTSQENKLNAENKEIIMANNFIETPIKEIITTQEEIIFDTLKLVRVKNEIDSAEEIYITQNQSIEIRIDGGNSFENENIIPTNKILTYETNH